ncbi:MAG: Uma2 family endonuclease [Candidatus Binatia bacterium]
MVVAYEREPPLAPRFDLGPYTVADYLALPDEPRCELIYGRFHVTPAPIVRHQEIVLRLAKLLLEHADSCDARVVVSPVDVVLGERTVVQPDIVYITAARKSIVGDRVEGAPDLVVEVLSPATARRDLGEKLKLYAEAGVAEYWLVDPTAKTFQLLENRGGQFEVRLPVDGALLSEAAPGFRLDLEAFWRALPE